MAVFGWVVLHGSNFDAFLVAELQNGEDTSEFTDHPLLEGEKERSCDDGGQCTVYNRVKYEYFLVGRHSNAQYRASATDTGAFYRQIPVS